MRKKQWGLIILMHSKRFDEDFNCGTTYEFAIMYFFYYYDILGSVISIVKPDGMLIVEYTYDEFGNKKTTEYDETEIPYSVQAKKYSRTRSHLPAALQT